MLKKISRKSLADKLGVAIRGFFMGAADVVPGVSGGTIAYITGLYPRLVSALGTFGRRWFLDVLSFKKSRAFSALNTVPYGFILPLLAGIFGAIFFFVWVFPLGELVEAHPTPFYSLFFGFVLTSALFLLRRYGSWCPRYFLFVLLGFLVAWNGVGVVPVETPETWWFVFIAGVFAISAMLLPGISGALVLLILGQYAHILSSLKAMDMTVILPFIAGLGTGLLLFGHILNWLINHYYRRTMLVMIGLLFGSLRALWPFAEAPATQQNLTTFTLFAAMGAGIIVVLYVWEGLLKAFPKKTNNHLS